MSECAYTSPFLRTYKKDTLSRGMGVEASKAANMLLHSWGMCGVLSSYLSPPVLSFRLSLYLPPLSLFLSLCLFLTLPLSLSLSLSLRLPSRGADHHCPTEGREAEAQARAGRSPARQGQGRQRRHREERQASPRFQRRGLLVVLCCLLRHVKGLVGGGFRVERWEPSNTPPPRWIPSWTCCQLVVRFCPSGGGCRLKAAVPRLPRASCFVEDCEVFMTEHEPCRLFAAEPYPGMRSFSSLNSQVTQNARQRDCL